MDDGVWMSVRVSVLANDDGRRQETVACIGYSVYLWEDQEARGCCGQPKKLEVVECGGRGRLQVEGRRFYRLAGISRASDFT